MAAQKDLLVQLLALDEATRLEIAHELLRSVDDEMDDEELVQLNAAIDRGIAEADAGQGIPIEQAIAEIRAKRNDRARATR